VIHWLLVALVVDACTLGLLAIVCAPYLRRRNFHGAYRQRSRRCECCCHIVEGYTFDELDYQEQLHVQNAHAPRVTEQLVEAA